MANLHEEIEHPYVASRVIGESVGDQIRALLIEKQERNDYALDRSIDEGVKERRLLDYSFMIGNFGA